MGHILLIDDSGYNLNVRREFLSKMHTVMNANTAKVAVDVIKRVPQDLIILNLDMSAADGVSIFRVLGGMKELEDIPFIIITKHPNSGDAVFCSEYENIEILQVPYENDELAYVVNSLVTVPEGEEPPPPPDKSRHSDKKLILIVDDDEIALDTLELYLSDSFDTLLANSGRAALEMLDSEDIPDVILLDVRMPQMDGLAFFKRIRNNPDTKNVPVIFQTGLSDIDTVKECITSGAYGYIVKPVRKDMLLHKLDEVLSVEKKSKHVLIISPDMNALNILKHHLRDNYKVSIECSLSLAMCFLSNQRPDMIILDDENPCIAFYKLRSKINTIPIVLMTETCSYIEMIRRCISMGAVGAIKNIYDKNEVITLTSIALGEINIEPDKPDIVNDAEEVLYDRNMLIDEEARRRKEKEKAVHTEEVRYDSDKVISSEVRYDRRNPDD